MRYSKVLLISFVALGLCLFLGAPLSHGQDTATGSHARIVRISYVEGTVQLDGERATMNNPIKEGSRLVTGADGVAEVQFEDSAAIRLASDTEITFSQLARLSSGEAITRVDLDEGEGEFLIPASSAGQFAVNARSKNILFAQPGRYRILSTTASPLEIAVWKGEAAVRDRESGLAVRVQKNETFTLNPDDPGQYDLEKALVADDLDQWSNQRDQDLSTALSSTYTAPNPSVYSSPYISNGGGYYSQPYLYGGVDYGVNAFGPCPYGLGFGGWQPFWLASSGCFNSGFFFGSPFFGSPFFFGSPVVVVVPPVRPRHPPFIHPPTPPVVAKGEPVAQPVKPGIRSFRFDGGRQRIFNQDNLQRSATSGEAVKPGGTGPETPHGPATPTGELVAPGQRSVSRGPVAPPHVMPASPPPPATHASAPPPTHASAPPSRSYSPPPSSSGSRGFSGSSVSHSSGSVSHSGGSSTGHH
jgi:FecR protein